MVWPVFLALSCALAFLFRRKRSVFVFFSLCSVGLVLMQVFKAANMGSLIWICSAALWVSIGAFVVNKCNGKTRLAGAALILSGVCYFFGRVYGGPMSTGNPVQTMADVFGIIAMLIAGCDGVISVRNNGLDCDIINGDRCFDNHLHSSQGKEVKKQIGRCHV